MSPVQLFLNNLLSPAILSFALGIFAKVVKSEITLPRELYTTLSVFLLLSLGLKGGVELAGTSFSAIALPAGVTLALGCITPVTAYLILRRIGKLSIADSAGIAAHYGSVSAVTFLAAQQFTTHAGHSPEPFMATLLTLLETPGIHIALAIGAFGSAKGRASEGKILHEILTSRSMILLLGGLLIGFIIQEKGYEPIRGFYEGGFKGVLTLFLMEMGLMVGARLGDLKKVGAFLLGFGIGMPILHGFLGVYLGHWAGLSIGGCTLLGTMASSASYIAAPPAVRITLPDANPTLSLTTALAVTFPLNLLFGIPSYYHLSRWIAG